MRPANWSPAAMASRSAQASPPSRSSPHESNASRVGVSVLNWHLAHWGYRFNDGKLIGPLWENMGFRDVPRREFLTLLSDAVARPGKSGRWQVETDLDTVSRWQPE